MAKYQTPGIYTEEISLLPPEIERGITTAVFIGYTEKHENENGENLLNIPTKINSIQEFESIFGKAQSEENIEIIDNSIDDNENIFVRFNGNQSLHNLYYSLVSFFENGGNSCKIVSVGTFQNIGKTFSAVELITGLNSLKEEKSPLLICVPEDQNLLEEDFYLLQKEIFEFCKTVRGFSIVNVPKSTKENSFNIIENYREKTQNLSTTLSFGATFFPNLVTILTYLFREDLVIIKRDEAELSLSSLKDSDEVLYQHYLYSLQKFPVILPPTGAVSGAFIRDEIERGIWKAPANIELKNISEPEILINNSFQNILTIDPIGGKSINAIRKFTGKGILIWGSRTLNGNDNEWRYIPVRRFVSLLEKDIQKALEIFIFEPNTITNWTKIKSMIENHLQKYWREGALQGAKPEQAYFVKCDSNTMNQQDILEERLIVQIGIAPIRPAEFIILEFKQKMLTN